MISTQEQIEDVVAGLQKLGFIRDPGSARQLITRRKWETSRVMDGVWVRVRKPRNASIADLSGLVVEIQPTRGVRGSILSFASLRVKTTEDGWSDRAEAWITKQLPAAAQQMKVEEQAELEAANQSAIRYKMQEELRVAAGRSVEVFSTQSAIAGAEVTFKIKGSTAEELLARIKAVLSIEGVS